MRIFGFITSTLILFLAILFLNGNIIVSSLPPLGKLLNPASGIWNNTEKDNDFKDLVLSSPGLKNDVTIVYDERKVPHIFAENLQDALYAQGYVEGIDRPFQMDFINRFASGNLSEVLGERTVGTDKMMRRKGIDFSAENALEGWRKFPEEMEIINAYIAGINQGFSQLSDRPVELKLLDYELEPWSDLKSARVSKWMADVLCGRSRDIEYSNLRDTLGQELFDFLYPDKANYVDPVIPTEVNYDFDNVLIPNEAEKDLSIGTMYKGDLYPQSPKWVGSNNWAVDGTKSSTNYPILSNDPHLQLTLPSVWYEVGIHTPEFNAYGVTIPGMPGIMIGFNDQIAWGETNVGQDVKDFFKIKWVDKSALVYELDGNKKKAEIRIEKIPVKGGGEVLDTVMYTYWGPVTFESEDGMSDMAMRWIGHDVTVKPEFMTFISGMKSKNYDEYLEATSNFVSPAQNFLYADKSGVIALRANGTFPAKADQDGKFVEDGTITGNDWQHYIPRNQNPQVINPDRGFISSANQRSTDESYPYYYNGVFEYSRNRSINKILASSDQHSVEDMKSYQLNTLSMEAMDILPYFISVLDSANLDEISNDYLSILKEWKYDYNKESIGATIYDKLFSIVRATTFDEIAGMRGKFSFVYPEQWRVIEMILLHKEHPVFDVLGTEEIENADDIVRLAYQEVVTYVEERKKEDLSLEWGKVAITNINHLMRLPAFSSGELILSGHPDALNAIGSTFGPSWRMVIALSEKTEAYGVFPGGQSGNPLSKFYKTSLDNWANGNYHTLSNFTHPDEIDTPLFTVKLSK